MAHEANPEATDLSRAAVLLCAHGRGEGGEGTPEAHAAALRARGVFARVEACALRGAPGLPETLAEMLAEIDAPRVFVVPLLMAEGHTSQVLLPALLARGGKEAGRVTLCRPIGVSPALAPLVVEAALAQCRARGWRSADATVVIAGHGTTRHEGSGDSAALLARRVAVTDRFRRVTAAFLEQAPFVEDVLRRCRPAPCVVAGFFMDHGGHSAGDIPRLIAAAHPDAAYTGAIGAKPGIADIILAVVRAAARA
jgi:sirohydrochlorin cobaltochelatase